MHDEFFMAVMKANTACLSSVFKKLPKDRVCNDSLVFWFSFVLVVKSKLNFSLLFKESCRIPYISPLLLEVYSFVFSFFIYYSVLFFVWLNLFLLDQCKSFPP